MTRTIILIALCLFLAACDNCSGDTAYCEKQREQEQHYYCTPWKVSEAPDGVILWKTGWKCRETGGRDVFFSTKGTQTTYCHLSGKLTTCEDKQVPNGQ